MRAEVLASERDELRASLERLESQRSALEGRLLVSNDELERSQRALSDERAKTREVEQDRADLGRQLDLERQRLKELEPNLARDAAQIAELRGRVEQLVTELAGAQHGVSLSVAEQERLATLHRHGIEHFRRIGRLGFIGLAKRFRSRRRARRKLAEDGRMDPLARPGTAEELRELHARLFGDAPADLDDIDPVSPEDRSWWAEATRQDPEGHHAHTVRVPPTPRPATGLDDLDVWPAGVD